MKKQKLIIDLESREKQARSLFEKAINTVNQGLMERAMHEAREALFFAKYGIPNLAISIHRFLAFANYDLGKFEVAKIHCYEAMGMLNPNQKEFRHDKDYLSSLMQMIYKASERRIKKSSNANAVLAA